MRIVSWNINSVRLRSNLIAKLTDIEAPDIICLQETKVRDELFPIDTFKEMGYKHIAFRGEKSYNGVAIFSKIPFSNVDKRNITSVNDARHISVILPGDIELHNFYIPAGGDEPDININPKYKHKLNFVDDMTRWFGANRKSSDKIIILGDFNIAPLEHDVWSSKQLRNTVSHTAPERERLNKLQKGLGWIDSGRKFIPEDEKLYSWWSYRNRDWKNSNRGRRLDHIWVTPALNSDLKAYRSLPEARDWEKPSDHVPVIVDL